MTSTTTPTPSPLSLTDRRKAETRTAIARAAAGLFVRRGLKATRAEDIAQAAGIAPRTFYRYFAAKEEAVAPLYEEGARRWAEAVRAAPAGMSVPEALEAAVRHTLTPGVGVSAASWEWMRTLIRLAESEPALRKVWAEVCQASERELADVLAERVTGRQVPGDFDNVAFAARLRFAAAVASAAVRTAVEGWAVGDASGEGPAELAVANLAALRGFPWGELGSA
ncbi:TetR/AcrR family transcriptional regulator [Streptomyces sp. 15-116A]|uniref:TetR/AcrR family transcriptional regulator n=1 Tax=Streptomyces sp. 15-116A TaxID=2259035 RepID=UPI0021B39313|nr:TetR/AcrR family transcriptional regulator [Streptomyces sp. 15-116A]MCT7355327.1 TetR/AcrR family transcriptional regulator [Streptomyces sp. 15-116A]